MICPDCGKPFETEAALANHTRAKHRAVPSGRLRRFVDRWGGVCHYCGHPVDLTIGEAWSATRDHVVPRALNGQNGENGANLVLACKRCNELRGHMDADAFRELMRGEPMTRAELWPHLFG